MTLRYGRHLASRADIPISEMIKFCISNEEHCVQVFLGSPEDFYNRRKLDDDDLENCVDLCGNFNFGFYTHFPYRMNLTKPQTKGKLKGLQAELDIIAPFNGRIVIHPNSPCDTCGKIKNKDSTKKENKKKFSLQSREAIEIMKNNLELLKYPKHSYPLLLEPPAGEGQKVGWSFEQMEMIVELCGHLPIGFCLDTCHVFALGVCDFANNKSVDDFFQKLEEIGVAKRVKAIHFNDSKEPFGSFKDRHETLCEGCIWKPEDSIEGMIRLIEWCKKLKIDIICEVGTNNDVRITKDLIEYID